MINFHLNIINYVYIKYTNIILYNILKLKMRNKRNLFYLNLQEK